MNLVSQNNNRNKSLLVNYVFYNLEAKYVSYSKILVAEVGSHTKGDIETM